MRGVYYLVFLLCLVSCGSVLAQHFPSKQYMIADGMPSNSIYDIAQDRDGMMWFMSKAGPTYYDSKTWYTFPDSLNLPTSTNSRIRTYSDRIWVAGLNDTHLTVQYFDGQWVEIGVPDEVAKSTGLLFFDVDDAGDEFFLVLGFKSEIHTYSSTEQVWKTVSISENLLINNIQKVDDKFLTSTNDGLYKIVEKKWVLLRDEIDPFISEV